MKSSVSKKYPNDVAIIEKYLHHLIKSNNVLKNIATARILHGGGFRYEINEKELITPIKEISTEITFTFDEVINFDLESLCATIYALCSAKIENIQRVLYKNISDASHLTGNIVDAGGAKLNYDLILNMLEKIEVDFDDSGNPIMPEFHMSTHLLPQLKDLKFSMEQEKKFNEIIEQKRKIWYAKKCYRKLSYITQGG